METCRLLSGAILANGSCVNFGENFEIENEEGARLMMEPGSRVMPSVEYFQYH